MLHFHAMQETKYTKEGPGTPGGSSWTPEWLHFDNSYFTEVPAPAQSRFVHPRWPPAVMPTPMRPSLGSVAVICKVSLGSPILLLPPVNLAHSAGRCLQVRDEKDPDLLVLSTDRCLFEDEGFR